MKNRWHFFNFIIVYYSVVSVRGVAQLVAHVVWDHGVGSSSLFTPTIKQNEFVYHLVAQLGPLAQ